MLRKAMICVYFGQFPPWFDLFLADFQSTMVPQGYKLFLDTDLPSFRERVKEKLGIEYTGVRGSGKAWDIRPALGLLYEEEIRGFDFYGHCEVDVVWGNINKFASDELLETLDVYSSHDEYVCGCFSLYRNSPFVNDLFKTYPLWKDQMDKPEPTAWQEQAYSRTLEQSGLRYKYDLTPQGNPFTETPSLKKENGKLYQQMSYDDWQEIGLFHFRRSKRWPL